jgi:hypothetical protein
MVLGLLTAIQVATGVWRIVVMFEEGLKWGFRPLALNAGFLEEIGLAAGLGFVAWWWLPRGERTAASWSLRFIVFAWVLALGQMGWVIASGFFEHGITWVLLALLFLAGTWARQRVSEDRPADASAAAGAPSSRPAHPALIGAVIFWLLQFPHLFFPYHWTDTKDIWACRTVAFEARGDLSGIFQCLDPGRPPLHSILLWLGHTNGTMEGRLLPFLMVGAFGCLVYYQLRRVAPRLAPWGLLWFFVTVRVYQGAVSNYADVPTMIALGTGVFLAVDDGRLVGSRWLAVLFAVVAGAAAALIKRDGGALFFVATMVLVWLARRRSDPRLYAAMVGATLGLVAWSLRPVELRVPDVYRPSFSSFPFQDHRPSGAGGRATELVRWQPPRASRDKPETLRLQQVALGSLGPTTIGVTAKPDTARLSVHTYLTMLYGMQGQVLSHYGFCLFLPCWIILAFWVWRRHEGLSQDGRLWGWMGVLGWLAIVGIYFFQVSTGHPGRGSLYVIRTAFGRHLVHMFVFALLNMVALAEVLVYGSRAENAAV